MTAFFKGLWKLLHSVRFIILTLLVFYAMDFALYLWAPVERSSRFVKNDFEKTIISHGNETVYDKVIFGNSTLISSYVEEQSSSGYVNFGIDYGTVSDLYSALNGGHFEVRQELVVVLNCFVLLDTLETNPTYPWHKKALEPYVFFQRDRLSPVLKSMAVNLLNFTSPFELARHDVLNKQIYHGVMTDTELAEKISQHSELFWWQGLENYEKNIRDLGRLADWCEDNSVRLRVLWGPWNNDVDMPENFLRVMDSANEQLAAHGVEVTDMSNSLERKFFYDIGHLNYEYGAVYFTEVLDKWLAS